MMMYLPWLSLAIVTCNFAFVYSKNIVRFGQANTVFKESPHHRQLRSLVHEVFRTRTIILPNERPAVKLGELIEFELFDNQVAVGYTTNIQTHSEVETTWIGNLRISTGNLEQDLLRDDGLFALACVQKACTANLQIYSSNKKYLIAPANTVLTPDGEGLYVISEVYLPPEKKSGVNMTAIMLADKKREQELFHHNSVQITPNAVVPSRTPTSAPTSNPDTDLILDLLVFYTPEAKNRIYGGSDAAIKSAIYLANDEANAILERSEVSLRLRIVSIEYAGDSFVEPGTDGTAFGTMLDWLTSTTDSHIGRTAATLRNQYGADNVMLVNAANAYCGLAWVNTGFSSTLAYANYNANCLSGSVWMHEIGHTIGCYHDRVSDANTAALYPTYMGFGHCWEDASKTDCTCYKSIMVYDCNTTPNGCTSCPEKDYLANYNVYDSGNPTGTAIASCGMHIHNNRLKPIKYRKSTQIGGMISSVTPNYAINTACFQITINGWQLNPASAIDIITNVTLDGYPAKILNQTENTVTVLSPVVSTPSSQAGTVVVTTQKGRVTTLAEAFTFRTEISRYTETFQSSSLGIWRNNGSIPWTFTTNGTNVYLYKDGGLATTEALAKTELLWLADFDGDSTNDACTYYANSLTFKYWAYSAYSYCFRDISVWTLSGSTGLWSKVWTGSYASNSGLTPWRSMNMTFATNTVIGIKLKADTNTINSCRWWAPLKVDDLSMTLIAQCDNYACGISHRPSATPTFRPSLSFAPSGPSAAPTPTTLPTYKPSTNKPSRSPTSAVPTVMNTQPTVSPSTKTPTVSPSLAAPSALPTLQPTAVPTTAAPTATPTTSRPSAVPTLSPTATPTTASPTVQPTTAAPSLTPTQRPSATPTISPTKRPTNSPTLLPTRRPTLTPTRGLTASPSRAPTVATLPSVRFNASMTMTGLSTFTLSEDAIIAYRNAVARIAFVQVEYVFYIGIRMLNYQLQSNGIGVGDGNSNGNGGLRFLAANNVTYTVEVSSQITVNLVDHPEYNNNADTAYQTVSSRITQSIQSNNFTNTLQEESRNAGSYEFLSASVTGSTVSSATVSDPESSTSSSSKSSGISVGVVVGIVVGVVIGVIACIVVLYFMGYFSHGKANAYEAGNAKVAVIG